MVCGFIDRPTGPPADLESAVDHESIRFLFCRTGGPGNLVSRVQNLHSGRNDLQLLASSSAAAAPGSARFRVARPHLRRGSRRSGALRASRGGFLSLIPVWRRRLAVEPTVTNTEATE